ncbi:MAG: aminopeptidase [Chloroflexi bacterium]|nr:aminopeptidase [Chloroflexota bacterium]
MADSRMLNLAHLLVAYSAEVRPDDWVVLHGGVEALPLIRAAAVEVLQAGGHPTVVLEDDETQAAMARVATEEQLAWTSPLEPVVYEQADVLMFIRGASNTRAMTQIPPAKQRAAQKARTPLMATFMRRSAEGGLRWVSTLFPTAAYAQEADMSLAEYEDFVYRATFADQPDPVAKWQEIHDLQQRMVDWLKGKREVVVKGPHVDLTLSIEGRTFINSDGHHNMPSGEIFTGPVEDSVNGWVRFTYPALYAGREVEGVSFRFENGKVVEAHAEKNEAFLLEMLDTDPGARYLGEFAVGTNYGIDRFTKNILFDEKIGGTIHMAVGAGYPETGSKNKSGIHWDFICDMRTDSAIWVDGELFYKDGQFQV